VIRIEPFCGICKEPRARPVCPRPADPERRRDCSKSAGRIFFSTKPAPGSRPPFAVCRIGVSGDFEQATIDVGDIRPGAVTPERSALLETTTGTAPTPIEAVGRILQPTALGPAPYRVREEEIPPTGLQVSRVIARARWTDGRAYVWVARRTSSGQNERTTPLRFDTACE
jgi:hypothetical protein